MKTTAALTVLICCLSTSLVGCTLGIGGPKAQIKAVEQVERKCPPIAPKVRCEDPPEIDGKRVEVDGEDYIEVPRKDVDAALIRSRKIILDCQQAIGVWEEVWEDCP